MRLSFSAGGGRLAGMSYQRLDLWEAQTWGHGSTVFAQKERGLVFQDGGFSPQLSLLAAAGGNQATIWEASDR